MFAHAPTAVPAPTHVVLGDAVQARFLRDGDEVVIDGAIYRIGFGASYTRGGLLVRSAYNHLGGIEGLTFDPQEFVKLATAI